MEGGDELALVGTRLAHRQLHASDADGDEGSDLQESQADRIGAGSCHCGVFQSDTPQRVHQHVRGRGEPQPQLIGAERSAGESIGKQIELRFLDAVFHFTARAVQLFVEFTLPGNPFDGHTLQSALSQVERLTDTKPKRCFVDRGYRGHGIEDTEVYIAGQKRGITRALRRALKRRNAIEPIIGHTKHDGLMGRNYLKGSAGDAMNAILAAAGHNLRIILRKLRLSWLWFLRALLGALEIPKPLAAVS